MSQSLCWPASRQGPAGPRVGSGLLWVGWVYILRDCSFLVSGVCLIVGEADLEASAGFLESRARDCPLVGRAVLVLWWARLCLEAACLLTHGALSPPSCLFGLRCPQY